MADTEAQSESDAIRSEVAASREAKPDDTEKPDEPTDIEQIAAQADKPDAVKKALESERERAKVERKRAEELALKVKEFEDRDKSDQERLEERAKTAEEKAATLEAKLLRRDIAAAKELPLDLADRLQGSSQEELEADADRLLELVKPKKPAGDIDAGKGEGAEGRSFNDDLRAALYR